ncbi:aminopeptidase P family protein [Sagittula salina]|uniref:Aminopeptidase P family protein n=1 Tax=Sagittula salina TaxID=2820268 RepID=A0A940MT83_9RHOB|nr:aminopeptidase P family protein [Sagittula salina]MBP0484238.1 aminopeptidase P family protein [Sagittula salina]
MFQTFTETASPTQGPARLASLQAKLKERGLDGFLVPRADAHQGEYVAPHDDRLAWLTGFTGSAGWAIALQDRAAIFTDSRYTVQVKAQTDTVFEKVDWPGTTLGDWLAKALPEGRLAYDPWLLTLSQKRELENSVPGLALVASENLIDALWQDQPAPPMAPAFAQPLDLAGEAHGDKIARLARGLIPNAAAVITLPDSIAWLLNIRGADIPRNPVAHGFAILHREGRVDLFVAEAKTEAIRDHLGPQVALLPPEALMPTLDALKGPVLVDPATCPVAISDRLAQSSEGSDPCVLPKASKNAAELDGTRAAHRRDATAMVRFLHWVDQQTPGSFTEIDVVRRLEDERRNTNALRDISFETISGAGPNGAIVHYRVTEATNRSVDPGLLLVDSGGQYVDGTTDITRTICVGEASEEQREAFTRVLKGMIALSRLRFPKGLAGRDIDALARTSLWEAGLDYGHGTGHGVGSYLCVHEGPARIARTGTVPFEPGMILSNEPGFYREGAYGIRIENLVVVEEAPALPGQTVPQMYRFETLTLVPIDRRLVMTELLTTPERDWINAYHQRVLDTIGPHVDDAAGAWLALACAPL